jgi:hypothetical protein
MAGGGHRPMKLRHIASTLRQDTLRGVISPTPRACALAEREGLRKIFTVDRRDFSVYRITNRTRPTLIP